MIAPVTLPVPAPAAAAAAALRAAVPVLVTPRCRLRAPELSDFDALHSVTAADRGGFMGGASTERESWSDFCAMVALWLLRGHGMWSVDHGGALAGFVLIGLEPGDAEHELGFLFRPAFEGRGLAHEAAAAARDWAWDALRLSSLVSSIATGNVRSERLAARLGATPDGTGHDGRLTIWRHRRPL